MDNVSKEIEELNTATEIKNAFDGLITRLNIAEKTISEPKNKSTETFKTEKQTGKNRIFENCRTTEDMTYV